MPDLQMLSRRYRLLDRVGSGGMGTVYRAKDRLGDVVALKRLEATSGEAERALSPSRQFALIREFRILSSIRHPNIVAVLDFGFDQEQLPYYTMELLSEARTFVEAAAGAPVRDQIDLLVQLMRALRYLHGRGVLHRDLKPSNVLVVGDRVKVVDFGLAAFADEKEELGSGSGTPGYMAPEVREGAPPSPASDLFAVGVMAYQIFAAKHPFVAGGEPDFSLLEPRVREIVGKLLAPRPADRFGDAGEVIAALARASEATLAAESRELRENRLRGVALVGREQEMLQLEDRLDAVFEGHGGACVVRGESGVGKSRLVDELRTHALVAGATVVTGQGIDGGGQPFGMWANVLRSLAIFVDPTPQEAGVLRHFVSDLERLMESDVAIAEAVDPELARARLWSTLENLLRRFEGPGLLLILEDVQWAGADSLEILSRVATLSRELPLLVIATARDDEGFDPAGALPELDSLELRRLSPQAAAELCRTLVGSVTDVDLIDRLREESEGNPFFLVEIAREWIEHSRGESLLPQGQAWPDKLRNLVQRRLDRIPGHLLPLLQVAAIAGREIDLALLARVAPRFDVEEWISACTSVNVLEARDEQVRFCHDKLREGLLAQISSVEQQRLHRLVAEIFDELHSADAAWAGRLAHHYLGAGDEANAVKHLERAVDQAMLVGAYREVVGGAEQILRLGNNAPGVNASRAHACGMLAMSVFWTGDKTDSIGVVTQGLEALGMTMPAGSQGETIALLHEIVRALDGIARRRADSPEERKIFAEAAFLQALFTEYTFVTGHQARLAFWSALRAINFGLRAGPCRGAALAYATALPVATGAGLWPLARLIAAGGEIVANQSQHPWTSVFATSRQCRYYGSTAQWEKLESAASRFLRGFESHGIRNRLWEETSVCLAFGLLDQGKFAGAQAVWQGVAEAAASRRDVVESGIHRRGVALCRLRLGNPLDAQRCFEEPAVTDEHLPWLSCDRDAFLGLACLQLNDRVSARANAERAVSVVGSIPPMGNWVRYPTDAVLETLLTLWETEDDERERAALKGLVLIGLQALQQLARTLPSARPSNALWQGLFCQLSGMHLRARVHWQRAIFHARRLKMPYEEARARLELGRHTGNRGQLERAAELFERLGTRTELHRALRTLG